MQKLAASERRREKLEDMVSVLEERCTLLEGERDRAREDALAELQHELQMSTEYRRQADQKLEHARRAEERAYQLRLAAERQVTIERMALRRLDQDVASEHPPLSAQSLVQELNRPPLDQIHELLNVVQDQLDAQDDELNDLDEQIDLGARQVADGGSPRPSPRVVQGRLAEDPQVAEHHVFGDKPRKPLTSKNGARTRPNESDRGETRADQARGDLGVKQPTELVIGLKTANTPAALSTALSQLRQRTGRHSISELTQAAFPGRLTDDLVLMTVMRWIDGDVLPDTWLHLKSLVRAMGATDQEVEAFQQAYARTIDTHLPGLASPNDLSDLAATRRLTGIRGPLARPWNWITAVLSPCLIVLITTAYTAALRSEPRPSLWRLAGYGAPFVLICALVLIAAVKQNKPFLTAGGRRAQSRSARVSLGVTLIAFPVGLAAPWVLNSEGTGRWLATLIGLVQ
ncbi:hypothetical protein [Streptomyces sp. HB132]|uniref:hypothetical protein n=1 Tax=Streptomyces sp. HB132 TaxID=767388 RepID=UPI001961E459|nr:hypothetical protein [Streptomyces sp. HB132]MBM7443118.1 hypothetical protein [Streptomyces sp. HB132]